MNKISSGLGYIMDHCNLIAEPAAFVRARPAGVFLFQPGNFTQRDFSNN